METSKSGQPIYRYQDSEDALIIPSFIKPRHLNKYNKFIKQHIGPFETVFHEIASSLIHVDIYVIEPSDSRNYYTLVTSGMSALKMKTPPGYGSTKYAELMISLPPDWKFDEESLKDNKYYWPIFWLKYLARFPHKHNTWLGSGHTMPNGDPAEPIAPNTELRGFVLLPTVLFGKQGRVCKQGIFKRVNLYTIHPLHESEMQLKLENGIDALFDLFDDNHVSEVVDLSRKPVC